MIGSGDTGLSFQSNNDAIIPRNTSGAARTQLINLGTTGAQFKDGHFSGTVNAGSAVINGDIRIYDNANDVLTFGSALYQTIAGSSGSNDLNYRTYANHIFKVGTSASSKTDGSEAMRINASGNVGIGTSSPDSALHVAGTGQEDITVTSSHSSYANWSGLRLYNTNDSANGTNTAPSFRIKNFTSNAGVLIENEKASTIEFKTNNNSDQLVLQSNGNVGINKNNPSEKLEVNGTVKATAFVGDGSGLTGISGGGGGDDGPAFQAHTHSSGTGPPQSLGNNTWTKANFGHEVVDTDNCFANSRFTPDVAGWYIINCSILTSTTSTTWSNRIRKNSGTSISEAVHINTVGNTAALQNSAIVYLNGSTDYVEVDNKQNSGSTIYGPQITFVSYFNGALVRKQ